jgi:hypothetical protein
MFLVLKKINSMAISDLYARMQKTVENIKKKKMFSNLSSSSNEGNEMKQSKRQLGLVADTGKK